MAPVKLALRFSSANSSGMALEFKGPAEVAVFVGNSAPGTPRDDRLRWVTQPLCTYVPLHQTLSVYPTHAYRLVGLVMKHEDVADHFPLPFVWGERQDEKKTWLRHRLEEHIAFLTLALMTIPPWADKLEVLYDPSVWAMGLVCHNSSRWAPGRNVWFIPRWAERTLACAKNLPAEGSLVKTQWQYLLGDDPC